MNDLDFILFCSIKFYKNKRKSLPNLSSGEYRPHIILNTEKDYLGFSFKQGEVNNFDEEVNCFLFPLYDEIDYSPIGIGKKFFIVEGSKKVGEGIIDEIIYNTNGDNDMEKMNHKFFKELDLVNGIKNEIDFGDATIVLWKEKINGIKATLWYDKQFKITTEILDVFAKFIGNFAEYNQKAIKALENYLTEDNEYITFHIDEVELNLPKDITKFVECMNTTNIGLWIGEENIITVDYMIAPEETDEILSVKFDSSLEIIDIAWES